MAGLVSDQLLNSLRRVAYKQLITDATVTRTTRGEGPYGTQETVTTVGVFKSWFVPQFKGDLSVQPGGLIAHGSGAEFRFAMGTDIQIGDRISVAGQGGYVVQDVNTDASIILYLKAWAQRTE